MNPVDDDLSLAEHLKCSVMSLDVDGPGPDLASVRRRGTRRRRIRQAAVGGALAAAVALGALARRARGEPV